MKVNNSETKLFTIGTSLHLRLKILVDKKEIGNLELEPNFIFFKLGPLLICVSDFK